jgi:hypothetical protein
MSYPWNNENNLPTLKVGGESEVLLFEVGGGEKAEVRLKDGDIDEVIHTLDGRTHRFDKASAQSLVVGENNWQRDVSHYLRPGGPSPWLRLGITHHRGLGTWSSLPHPFELNCEKDFEEVFFYLLTGGNQTALQVGRGVWCDGARIDDIWTVKDHSWGVIPMGYHPVVGEPSVQVSYVWAYLAKKKEWEKI